ncbi:MAG: PQQ-binding-like beta-propeller repeat protein [Pirellula sp.]|nr:PQQ-binding-like beta-propeller repeat protein [Pirellula sp.]
MFVPPKTKAFVRRSLHTVQSFGLAVGLATTLAFPCLCKAEDESNKSSSAGNKAKPTDWVHWRGPLQNGHSLEKGLPDTFSAAGENLLWRKEEFATRATPIVMNGRLYTICRSNPDTTKEAEKTVCVNAVTGELIWESIHNIFLSDAPAERVGWASLVGDPETDKVYMLGLGCLFQCLDGKTGKILWEKSMLEEYGMLSTYGGRTNFPVVFEDMIIISGVLTGWDQSSVPAHRILALDKSTGAPIWMTSTRVRPEDTTYSTPVFTVLNGQAAMVLGAADGALYALQPRTGKVIWKYQASPRGLNVTPLIEDGIVYCGHGEQNETDRTVLGAVFAFDGNTTGDITIDKLLWNIPKRTVSRSSPVKIDNRVYFVDDGGAMFGVNAKTGEVEVEKKLGRIMFGSLVVSEGKMYIGENSGVIHTLKPTATSIESLGKTSLRGNEVFGSFAISNGRLYLPTTTALYCIGKSEIKVDADPMPKLPVEPMVTDKTVAHIQACPVELLLSPGQKAKLQVRAYNAAGQYLRLLPDATITVEGGGSVSDDLIFTAPTETTGSAFYITASSGELKSIARGRVIPALPWKFDFEDKKVPLHWIGAAYRHQPFELPTGGNGLVKISTIPKGVRSQAFLGKPNVHDYTVQAEVYATDTKNKVPTTKLPDMGVVNQRYTLALEGSQKLQIRSWVSLGEQRFAKTIPFDWQANTWYTVKLRSENKDGKAVLQGKVWKTGETEPEAWTIEGEDALPNTVGSPGLFGNSTDAEIYIDNVSVTAN